MTNELNAAEAMMVARLVDAGIKAAGIQVFENGGGVLLSGALQKLQAMAAADPENIPTKEGHANGAASSNDLPQ